MNRLFRWGIIIALFILIASGLMAVKIVFVADEEVPVPSIIGMTGVDAANTLQNSGLVWRIDRVESTQPLDIVISQSPSAGEMMQKGKIVVVRVSKGGTKLNIPDVRGKEFAEAARLLDAAGFKVGTVLRVADKSKAAGSVIAQNPAAQPNVPSDRMVDLLISEGAAGKNEMILVPDLKGQTERLARQILEQSGLSVSRVITVESDQVAEGTVLRSQPIAGSRVPQGNAIVIYLAKAMPAGAYGESAGVSYSPPNASAQTGGSQNVPPPVSAQPPEERGPANPPAQQTPAPPVQAAAPPATAPAAQAPAPQAPVAQTPPPAAQAPAAPAVQTQTAPASTPTKTAKIRYQVPPLARPLAFKITIKDDRGTRVLREQQARGGEYVTMDIGYTGSASVEVQLGSEVVWQEKYR